MSFGPDFHSIETSHRDRLNLLDKLSDKCCLAHARRPPEDHGMRPALVERAPQRLPGYYAALDAVDIERVQATTGRFLAEPTVAQGFARCVERGATLVVAHPFMLAPGRHAREDLPRLVSEAAAGHEGVEFSMARPLGAHDGVIDAVVARCEAALAERDR